MYAFFGALALAACLVCLVALINPFPRLGLHSRKRALGALLGALVVFVVVAVNSGPMPKPAVADTVVAEEEAEAPLSTWQLNFQTWVQAGIDAGRSSSELQAAGSVAVRDFLDEHWADQAVANAAFDAAWRKSHTPPPARAKVLPPSRTPPPTNPPDYRAEVEQYVFEPCMATIAQRTGLLDLMGEDAAVDLLKSQQEKRIGATVAQVLPMLKKVNEAQRRTLYANFLEACITGSP